MGQIKTKVNGKDRVVGIKARTNRKTEWFPTSGTPILKFYFERGIDNYGS